MNPICRSATFLVKSKQLMFTSKYSAAASSMVKKDLMKKGIKADDHLRFEHHTTHLSRQASICAKDCISLGGSSRLSTHFTFCKSVRCMSTSAVKINISEDRKSLQLETSNRLEKFNATWLRHNCRCPACIESHSGQKTLKPCELKACYSIKHAKLEDGVLMLQWENEGDHSGEIPVSYLEENSYSEEARKQKVLDTIPTVCKGDVQKVAYEEIINSEDGLWRWLKALNEEGLCLVQGVPPEDGMVKKAAENIWTIQPTIYGETFQVESVPSPINIAYTSEKLVYHMDLVYYESPPGLQFLLCKKFDDCVEGGDSIFVDSWYVAEQLRVNHPEDFNILTRVPATFQKIHLDRERPVHMSYQRPHIVLDLNGQITNMNWAPPFEGPLCVPERDVEPYYRAYHKYAEMLQDSESTVKLKLRKGELIAFNNRRILHGRENFELNSGGRLLEGCYMNIDEFQSQVNVLGRKFNQGKPAKHVFNQSFW